MPKSKNFNKVKRYYEKHFWTKKEVYDAVMAYEFRIENDKNYRRCF